MGDEHNCTDSTTKKGDGKEEHHAVPGWYSPDPPIPHPHINNRGDPPKLAAHTFAQWQVLMKSHVHSSCIDLWNTIEEGLKIEDPTNLTRREVVNSQLNATALHMIQLGLGPKDFTTLSTTIPPRKLGMLSLTCLLAMRA